MRYIVWLARLLVFVVVLVFALNNTAPVDIRFYGAYVLADTPLIVVMLVAFVLGTGFSLLLSVCAILRRGRELKRLKRELARLQDDARYPAATTASVPETLAPLAPL